MTKLHPYRQTVVTPDTYEALCRLERAAHDFDGEISLGYEGVSARDASWQGVEKDAGPLGLAPWMSMRPTGREVYLRIQSKMTPEHKLAVLWGLAVPLGFIPWSRYPVPSSTSHVFHYLGPWDTVGDFLHGEGRGDLAWPSMCCAAQIEVGTWQGTQFVERTVQTHLHRLGIHCGPIDGNIGPVTISAMKALGLGGLEISQVAETLAKMKVPAEKPRDERVQGHVVLGGYPMEAFTTGGVHTVKTRNGYALTVDGPGRLVLMVGE
jgi:hypothetical protein